MSKFMKSLTLDEQDDFLSILDKKGGLNVLVKFLQNESERTDMELRVMAKTMEDVQYVRGQRVGLALVEKFLFHDAPRFYEQRNQKRASGE